MLVHGLFFRDFKYVDYWGRIPKELVLNGATIFYGEHQSASSIAASAAEIRAKVDCIIRETGCEKVNVIAHSKGGLDCRYAMSFLGMAPYVASLTTINTPHRGCEFVDQLLNNTPKFVLRRIAKSYNTTLKRLGDYNPDFITAIEDLGLKSCSELDKAMIPPDDVYCRSIGSKINRAKDARLPFSLTHNIVRQFDGINDGIVGEESFRFGESYALLATDGKRGISHGDMIDMTRENIEGFDVREFYVQLVADLKKRGL